MDDFEAYDVSKSNLMGTDRVSDQLRAQAAYTEAKL
jgi:hypothetical protein